jgi:2-haloacid dehalogenase
MTIKAVVFDFGGVLIDWSPEYLYRQLIPDEAQRRWFLTHVCAMDWVVRQDGGQNDRRRNRRTRREVSGTRGADSRVLRTLARDDRRRARRRRGAGRAARCAAHAAVRADQLVGADVSVCVDNFPVLRRFKDIVVSGHVKLVKPDPAIYRAMRADRTASAGCRAA